MPGLRLMEPAGDSPQRREVANHIEVGLLATDIGRVPVVEEVTGEILEGVVSSLARSPHVTGSRRGHRGIEGAEQGLAGAGRHPAVHPDHAVDGGRRRYPA